MCPTFSCEGVRDSIPGDIIVRGNKVYFLLKESAQEAKELFDTDFYQGVEEYFIDPDEKGHIYIVTDGKLQDINRCSLLLTEKPVARLFSGKIQERVGE